MCVPMRVRILVISIAILLLVVPGPSGADRGAGSIQLSSNPAVIAADGKSVCTVTAEVRDRDGRLVPDGTEIRFTASLGVIEETATTSAGVARVKLISADMAGTSVVTASWVEGQAVAQTNVEFSEGPAPVQGPQYISIDADEYLAYSIDYKVFEALGNVRIRYRSLELEAEEAQIDLETNRIVARGEGRERPVKLRSRGSVAEGSMFTCDMLGLTGLLLSAERGSVTQVDISKSVLGDGGGEVLYMPQEFDFADLSDSSMLVKASRATVFPNERIQFKNAKVYVDGKRMLSLPLYVLSLTGYLPEGEQYVGYSTGGITLNLPVYYSLTPSSSGALLVRHGESTGWGEYGQTPGWFVDVRQRYATDRAQGVLALSQITRGDWGAHLSHSQQLGKQTRGYIYLDYPAHRDLYGNLNLSRSFDGFDVGLNLSGSDYSEIGDWLTSDLYVQTRPKPLGKLPFRYTLSSRSAYATGSGVLGDGFSQHLQGNIHSAPIPLARTLSFRNSIGLGYIWGDSTTSGLSVLGTAMLDWKVSQYSSFQLSYRFADRASIYASRTGKQTLSATCLLRDNSGKWRASMYAIRGLDYPMTTVLADFGYRFNEDWRFGVRSTLSEFGHSSYDDFELSVGKMVGSRELVAVWSKSQKRVMFELGSGGF